LLPEIFGKNAVVGCIILAILKQTAEAEMDETSALLAADRLVDEYVQNVKDDQWELPTPDPDWTVRDLVQHLVYEEVWTPDILSGKTVEEVGGKYDGDLLGDNPKIAWMEAATKSAVALDNLQSFDQSVHLSFGDVSAGEYLQQCFIDRIIHGWDLAKATGQAEELDPRLVDLAFDWFAPQAEEWRAAGLLGPAIDVPEDASLQTKLLALSGRQT
jgi:uncharacterized protein (TIGR03086 family)